MSPWLILAAGFVATMILSVVLRHRVEMTRLRHGGDASGDYIKGFNAGLDRAGTIALATTCDCGGKERAMANIANACRAARRINESPHS